MSFFGDDGHVLVISIDILEVLSLPQFIKYCLACIYNLVRSVYDVKNGLPQFIIELHVKNLL